MPDDQPADPVDDLFTLPVSEFIAARDALARRLKADGDVDAAAHVKGLRRPTLAAWAVNQVVRQQPQAWQDLVAAGQDVQRAQRRALSGVADSGLREASAARRRAVEELTDRAATILAASGARPDSHLEDVAASLEAATADPSVTEQVAQARLSAPVRVDVDFSGASALLAMSLDAAGTDEGDDGNGVDDEDAQQRRDAMRVLRDAQARSEQAATTAREQREAAAELIDRARRAGEVADDARQRAQRAEAEAVDLRARADQAERRALEAGEQADAAGQAARDARAALDGLA